MDYQIGTLKMDAKGMRKEVDEAKWEIQELKKALKK